MFKFIFKKPNSEIVERVSLVPIFIISAVAVGFEMTLTRYFSITSWSQYSYWVISITMVGFAVSGVILSIFKNFFEKYASRLLSIIPLILLATATLGYLAITIIPFNPLEFQDPNTWLAQLINIWKYYGALSGPQRKNAPYGIYYRDPCPASL